MAHTVGTMPAVQYDAYSTITNVLKLELELEIYSNYSTCFMLECFIGKRRESFVS